MHQLLFTVTVQTQLTVCAYDHFKSTVSHVTAVNLWSLSVTVTNRDCKVPQLCLNLYHFRHISTAEPVYME